MRFCVIGLADDSMVGVWLFVSVTSERSRLYLTLACWMTGLASTPWFFPLVLQFPPTVKKKKEKEAVLVSLVSFKLTISVIFTVMDWWPVCGQPCLTGVWYGQSGKQIWPSHYAFIPQKYQCCSTVSQFNNTKSYILLTRNLSFSHNLLNPFELFMQNWIWKMGWDGFGALGFQAGLDDPFTALFVHPLLQTHVNCLSHLWATLIPLYISMFIHDTSLTVAHQEVAGGRVAGRREFPRWQHVKGRHTHTVE